MAQNSDGLLNRIEIDLYSLLISCLSLAKGATSTSEPVFYLTQQSPADEAEPASVPFPEPRVSSGGNWWTSLGQALVSLFIWMVLGFAAGFLIGMVMPG